MKIIALDLGTKTGWAVSGGNGKMIESGVQVFDVKRGESPGLRYMRFRSWLHGMIDQASPAALIYEQSHNRGGAATEVAAGFATRVQEIAAERGLEHGAVHTATLKKWTTGSGRADKVDMVRAVNKRFKPGVTSDDEADAIALLHYSLENYK